MADLSKTVEIVFGGVDDVTKEINKIGKNVENFGNDMQDIGEPFLNALEAVALLNAAIAGIAVVGIKASSDIEAQATKMQNSLGMPTEEVQRFEEIAKKVYTGGFGEDLISVFDAVTAAQKKFGDNASIDIGKVTEQGFKIQKVFGTDINESLSAVRTLMKNFGLDSDEAFDFIVSGFQKGLDTSGDFLESVTEYSTQFANGGADAGEFFSVLETGLADGILGTDKAADAFKEFRVRIIDDSKATNDALESLGFDPDAFADKIASGEMSAIEAFGEIQKAMAETEDKQAAFNAGVALMGSQFEDLGEKAVGEINITKTSIESLSGAMDNIDTGDFSTNFISALRTVQTEFGDLTIWEEAKDKIISVFSDIADNLGPALENADFSGLEEKVGELWDTIANIFKDNDIDLTTPEGMENAVNMVVESLESLASVTTGIIEILSPAADAVIAIIDGFNNLDPDMQELVGNVMAVGTAFSLLGGIVAIGGVLMTGLSSLVGYIGAGGTLISGMAGAGAAVGGFLGVLTGPVGLVAVLAAAGAAIVNFSLDQMAEDSELARKAIAAQAAEVKKLTDQIKELPLSAGTVEIWTAIETGDLELAQQLIDDIVTPDYVAELRTEADVAEATDYWNLLSTIPEEKRTDLMAAINAGDAEAIEAFFTEYDGEVANATVGVDVDQSELDSAKTELEWFDESGTRHSILVDVEDDQIDQTKKAIEDIPNQKLLEIQLQGDIDTQITQIEAQAETAQAAFQYTAEVNIADAQAQADILTAAFDATGQAVEALSSSTSGMFSDLLENWESLGSVDQSIFTRMAEQQMEMQEEALESQLRLNEAQSAYLDAKVEALERGDAMIQIESTGLEPALEMVMWNIIEKVQIRANEESADFLLGI